MKKVILFAAAVAAITFASCENKKGADATADSIRIADSIRVADSISAAEAAAALPADTLGGDSIK
jgi:hypothetical protein